ncbi:MAG: molybdate ABC transporter substrate-binding protein [Actinobacteria bacterium]|nr:molybdate ABC transporter substrate-binding protein [Actinomycetota bacterium]
MTWRFLILLLVAGLVTSACGSSEGSTSENTTVKVAAAASLTEAFTAMAKEYESDHPGVRIMPTFAASSALAQQVNDGAPVDVFASADEANMKKVTDAGSATGPRVFARNRLAILVAKGNPKGIKSLADLANPGVVFLLCAPEVPCGRFGAAALTKAGIKATPASLEENVKGVVSKVTLGEADAGIVYSTDVKAAGDKVEGVGIDIAGDPALTAAYPIAVTKQAEDAKAANGWVDFVLSEQGQRTLSRFGFLPP